MHARAPEMSLSSFLDCPMEAIEGSSQQPLVSSAGYISVDPFTLIPYPEKVDMSPDAATLAIVATLHGSVASSAILSNPLNFEVVPTSSLDSALDFSACSIILQPFPVDLRSLLPGHHHRQPHSLVIYSNLLFPVKVRGNL